MAARILRGAANLIGQRSGLARANGSSPAARAWGASGAGRMKLDRDNKRAPSEATTARQPPRPPRQNSGRSLCSASDNWTRRHARAQNCMSISIKFDTNSLMLSGVRARGRKWPTPPGRPLKQHGWHGHLSGAPLALGLLAWLCAITARHSADPKMDFVVCGACVCVCVRAREY